MKKTIVIVTGTIVLLLGVICILNFNNIDLKFTILNNKQWDKNLLLDLVYSAPHKREVYGYTFSEDAIKISEKQYFPAINGYLPKEIFEEFGYTEEEVQKYGQVALYCKELKYKILVLDDWRAVEDNIYTYTIAIKDNKAIKNIKIEVDEGFTATQVTLFEDSIYLVGSMGQIENEKFKDRILFYKINIHSGQYDQHTLPVDLPVFHLESIILKDDFMMWSGVDADNENIILKYNLTTGHLVSINTKMRQIYNMVVNKFIYGFYRTNEGLNYVKIGMDGEIFVDVPIVLPFKKMGIKKIVMYNNHIYGVVSDFDITNNTYIFKHNLNSNDTVLIAEIRPHNIKDIFIVDTNIQVIP